MPTTGISQQTHLIRTVTLSFFLRESWASVVLHDIQVLLGRKSG